MESLCSVALSNALAATVLAVVAVLSGRLLRRPAVTHGLWLLVLLKLLTPPLFRVPVAWPSAPAAAPVVDEQPGLSETIDVQIVVAAEVPVALEESVAVVPAVAPTPAAPIPWGMVLATLWLSGSLAWLVLVWRRVRPFCRLLQFAQPAPESLTQEVRDLADRLGLRRVPGVWLVPGKLSPMLWTLGGPPRLLLPAELLAELNAEQRATLLVHELAHLHRGDHWVRWLELLVAALYWWHPLVWWARRELREAEEQCCDAWVVWALPGAGRTYAAALLECLDFLSETPGPLPAGASGLGHIADLKRRLTMIVQGTTPRRLTRGGLLTLLGTAVVLLPWLPSWADDRKPDSGGGDRKPDNKNVDQARQEVEKLRDELTAQVRKVHELEERLRAAAQRLHQAEGGKGERKDIRIEIREGERRREGNREGQPRDPGGRRPEGDRPPPMGGTPRPGPDGGRGPGGEDRRIQDLERRLEELTRSLQELRQQLRGPGRPPEGNAPRPRDGERRPGAEGGGPGPRPVDRPPGEGRPREGDPRPRERERDQPRP